MARQPGIPLDLPTGRDRDVVLLPTWFEPQVATEPPETSAGRAFTGRRVRTRKHPVREVVVIEVAGRLRDVVQELDWSIQLALAEGPRGVVCDLSAVVADAGPGAADGAGPVAVDVLASAGRHGRDWPGIPVAVACPDPRAREALRAHPLGVHLIVTESLFSAVSAVLATPTLDVQWLRLAPHPTAPRASRDFVTRTLLDWRLGRAIPFATLVVSQLVASSSVNAGTEMDVCVAWNLGALRLSVRDHGPRVPAVRPTAFALRTRGAGVVAGLSRAFGVLPAADGGQAAWAVLEAPRPLSLNRRVRSGRTTETHEWPEFSDGRGLAELPFCAGSRQQPT